MMSKCKNPAAAKPMRGLWERPLFGETTSEAKLAVPKLGKANILGRHYERSE